MALRRITLFSCFLLLFTCFAPAQNADIGILRRIHSDSSIAADKTFRFISHAVAPVSIGVPVTLLVAGNLNNDDLAMRNGYKTAISLALAGAVGSTLKLVVKRPRPFKTYDFIHAKDKVGPYSFPSNHTAFAFSAATSLSLAYPKWYVIGPAYLFAGLTAYSRMYLGVHFPLDVIGGMVIGVGSSLLVWEVDRLMNGK